MFKRIFTAALFAGLAFAASAQMQETPLASTSRTASANSADMYAATGRNGVAPDKGISMFGVVTSLPTNTLTFTIQGKRADGTYYDVLASTPTITTGTVVLKAYPGITAAANATASVPLPPVYRISVTQGGATASTYSVQVDRHK